MSAKKSWWGTMAEKGDSKPVVLVGYIYDKRERDDSGFLKHIHNEDERNT